MGQAITITNLEHSAADLRRLASRERNGEVVRRLLALAMILDGHSRTEAARLNGMERQTLRDWVHRYNAEGLAGLVSKVGPGPAPLLTEAQMAELRELVVKGPDPERDGVVRWRCVDLQDQVARRFSVVTTEPSVPTMMRHEPPGILPLRVKKVYIDHAHDFSIPDRGCVRCRYGRRPKADGRAGAGCNLAGIICAAPAPGVHRKGQASYPR